VPALAIAVILLVAPGHPAPPPALTAAFTAAPAGGARASEATRPLVGAPYVYSALGEGEGPDPDPRFRLDAFDCQGFLETALALGSSRSLGEAARALDDVRYDGPPALAARNHEMMSQWIPVNVAKGWLVETARALAGDRAVRVTRSFTREGWRALHQAGRAVDGLPSEREPVGTFELWVVRPEDLAALGPRIPDGTAVIVVREDDPRRPTRVSHVGLVVAGPGGARIVRHATAWPGQERVVEEPLAVFVERQRRAKPGWPLVGFALYALPDASARVAALGAQPN
jgi:hypothetical protein